MARRAWICGVDQIVAWYINNAPDEEPFYSVWRGRYIIFSYDGNDKGQGAAILEENLQVAANREISDILLIKLHKNIDRKGVNEKTPCWSSMEVQVCEADNSPNYAHMAYENNKMMSGIAERLDRLEKGGGDEDKGVMGMINGIMSNPDLSPIVGQVIGGLLGKLGLLPAAPMQNDATVPMASINGIEDSESFPVTKELYHVLIELQKLDPDMVNDLTRLVKLGKTNPSLFKTVLAQLRAL